MKLNKLKYFKYIDSTIIPQYNKQLALSLYGYDFVVTSKFLYTDYRNFKIEYKKDKESICKEIQLYLDEIDNGTDDVFAAIDTESASLFFDRKLVEMIKEYQFKQTLKDIERRYAKKKGRTVCQILMRFDCMQLLETENWSDYEKSILKSMEEQSNSRSEEDKEDTKLEWIKTFKIPNGFKRTCEKFFLTKSWVTEYVSREHEFYDIITIYYLPDKFLKYYYGRYNK